MINLTAKLKRARQRLSHHYVRGGLILMYHRITDARPDPWDCCVSPQHFAEQLAVLRRKFRPVPLAQLMQAVTDDQPSVFSRRPVAVTFDDGYADNLHTAKPLLERYEIPATVFVTSGHIGRRREFWSDELEALLLQPGPLPLQFQLSISGHSVEMTAAESASDNLSFPQWRAAQGHDPTPRHRLYRELYPLLQPLEDSARAQLLDEIRRQTGTSQVVRETHRFLDADELRTLAAGDLIEIGGHAATHPMMSRLSGDRQLDEITEGKSFLEELLHRRLTSFAYPYGDYGADSPALVREAGFVRACATRRGVVRPDSDCFALPRVQVKDWHGKEFAAWLTHWLYD